MTTKNNWFEVSKPGLAQLLDGKSRTFAIAELLQNAWDQNVSSVSVKIAKEKGSAYRVEVIDDDPDGWRDIADAFTLFKPSEKKADPTKRGRFNLGEKLVLSLCKKAEIVSVNHAVRFDASGRHSLRKRREQGSSFVGTMDLRANEVRSFADYVRTFLAPTGISTSIEILGECFQLSAHDKVCEFTIPLPTVISDAEGNMKRTTRRTIVELFEVRDGETATIYEMGIPVVELDGDKWHINVQQKIPLNMDRDNVTPTYLAALRVAVLNEAGHLLDDDDATDDWVSSAAADERVTDEAVERVVTSRYGEKRVAYDPSDPEANKIAVSKGYTVVPGGSMTSGLWANAKDAGALLPAGRVTPSPRPYSDDPNAEPVTIVPESEWTVDQARLVAYAKELHTELIGHHLSVRLVKVSNFTAAYGQGCLDINANNGAAWFREENFQKQLAVLLHEFAHHFCGDHFDHKFHDAICMLSAKLAIRLGARCPMTSIDTPHPHGI